MRDRLYNLIGVIHSVVVRIGGRILAGPDEFRRAVLGLRGKYRALLVVERGGRHYPVTVSLI